MTAEMRFQVPPKTFRLDSWITELDQATNLVVTVVPNRQALDWESPSAKSAATKPRIFSWRSTVTWLVYSIIDYSLYIVLDIRYGWLLFHL